MSDQATASRTKFDGVRVHVTSSLGFDEVLASLRSRMGSTNIPEVVALSSKVKDAEEYDRLVRERFVGPSGFMLFAEIDHGTWIRLYGIERRSVRLVIGNPLIAITMIRHDMVAGLFAPVELLLTEDEEGSGCTIDYVLPSSLIVIDKSTAAAELKDAAAALDGKFDALIRKASGATE